MPDGRPASPVSPAPASDDGASVAAPATTAPPASSDGRHATEDHGGAIRPPGPADPGPSPTTNGGTASDAADVADAGAPRDVPPEVAARLVRALDRSPSMFVTLIDADMHSAWLSTSATWITGTDPVARPGRHALERIHPDDVSRLVHGLAQLRKAKRLDGTGATVMEPLRYRIRRPDDTWITVESVAQNLLDDPEVNGLLVFGRPVGGRLDGIGHVIDLLVDGAELTDVLAACADLVPPYVGSAAVIGLVGEGAVVGAPAGSAAERLSENDMWWREALVDGRRRATGTFDGVPPEVAAAAEAEGFRSSWVEPLTDPTSGDLIGAIVTWVRLTVEPNIGTEAGLRQAARLATLVLGEQRRNDALRREAMTDPLTGLGNRTALRRRLESADEPVTMALIDLDGFKPVNDTHGHDVGDEVLRTVARRLLGAVREADCVVRFGGDEFAVVFADGSTPDGDAGSASRIRDAIEAPIHTTAGETLTVGASIGTATAPVSEVVALADKALYDAKSRRPSPTAPA